MRSDPRTLRQLKRDCRRALYRELMLHWTGTRATLRAAIRQAVRQAMKPLRDNFAWMLRVVREARFAALVAGTVLTTGLAGSAGAVIQLSDIAGGTGGFAMSGGTADERSGASVSSAGDVNGDGLADLIVGAYLADGGGLRSGRTYIIFGKSTGTPVQLSNINLGAGGFGISGEGAGDRSGYSVSTAGDVNGDGLADLIVGAFFADPNGSNSGRSYVVFGKADGTPVRLGDVTAGTGGFAIDGEGTNDFSGFGVSDAGDVNGDGLADLIVGAHLADPSGPDSGRSYVIFGKATGTRVQLSDAAAGIGGFAINGEATVNFSGRSVSAAGDVNGDGLADLIVGAYGAGPNGAQSGRSYVVFGKASGTAIQLSDVTSGGFGGITISGEAAGDRSGFSVSGAGDVNGDGMADLIVGAYGADPNGASSGRSYIVFGKDTGALIQLSNVTAGRGGFAIDGEAAGNVSGHRVSAAGDVNGDGLADVIIGARYAGPNGLKSGRTYIVFGKTTGTTIQLSDVTAGTGGFVVNGELANDRSGQSVSGAGDVNGDGLADLIVGADQSDSNGSDSGRGYVVFSPQTPPLTARPGVPASATYIARTRTGDGAGGAPVVPTLVGDSRAKIDFSDSDSADNGAGGASIERVTITRSKAGLARIAPRADVADVFWWIKTNRVGFTDANVTLKYLNSEIAGISGAEDDLVILTAPTKSGPWVQLASTVDAARNEISATVTDFSFFAIGTSSVGQQAAAGHWSGYGND